MSSEWLRTLRSFFMNLYSYSFPIKLENGDNSFEFKQPYTITTALHIENSHYVGYTITDSANNSVDVFNILQLKEYIKLHQNEFTNAKIDELSGQLVIKSIEKLPHQESHEFLNELEKIGLNEGLSNLLELAHLPRKFYSYSGEYGSLTNEAREYLNSNDSNGSKFIIPPPLCKNGDTAVLYCAELFSELDLYEKDVDFSLVNLSYYIDLEKLFYKSKIKSLDMKCFNVNPKVSLKWFASYIECDILSIENCDFSEMPFFFGAFEYSKIDEFKSIGCNMQSLRITTTHKIFANSQINKLDLGLFEKITVLDFYSLSDHLSNAKYDEIINEELLPAKLFLTNAKKNNSREYQEHERNERNERDRITNHYRQGRQSR